LIRVVFIALKDALLRWYDIVPYGGASAVRNRTVNAKWLKPPFERISRMTLALFQTLIQTLGSTLHWLGFSFGVRRALSPPARRWAWLIGSAAFSFAWLLAILLLASNDFFGSSSVTPPRIPTALTLTLLFGYLLLLSASFRAAIAAIPQHWLIGIQAFRVLGAVFLVRYAQGELPGVFALPAGIGDVLTGLFAPVVAYWWYTGKPYARTAAIAWNLFGMADLVNAVAIGALLGGNGIVFPIVMIPIYAVPRAFLIHSYSLIGLLRKSSATAERVTSAGLAPIPSAR
jgi:hypothetical protein